MSTAYELLDELGKQIPDVVVYTMKEWCKINNAVAELEAENERLRNGILEYGVHNPSCPQYTGPYDLGELEPACTCGLAKLLASLDAEEGE